MIKHMNHLARTLLGCIMLLCTTMVYAQHAQFKGQVIDQEGNPLVGATVVVKGANNKNAVADMSGEFVLQNLEKNAVLQISYIGFQTQEVKVGAENSVRVVLKEDEAVLGEVVVVGYGTQKKQTLTGAISTLSGDKVLTRVWLRAYRERLPVYRSVNRTVNQVRSVLWYKFVALVVRCM